MSKTEMTAEETLESLTGFDEIAIAKWFDDIATLESNGGSMIGRALVFVTERRGGATDVDAHAAAMSMTLREVNDFFADEADESGKDGGPQAVPLPDDSPDSA